MNKKALSIIAVVFSVSAFVFASLIGCSGESSKSNSGLSMMLSDPQISYNVAITADRNVFDIDGDIPLTIHIGTGTKGVDEIEIWSVSQNVCFKENDPIILQAKNGDFASEQLLFAEDVKYKAEKEIKDLPFEFQTALTAQSSDQPVDGLLCIYVRLSGIGFYQQKKLTLQYSIRGSNIEFSTISELMSSDYGNI